jgi:hypothetical protein
MGKLGFIHTIEVKISEPQLCASIWLILHNFLWRKRKEEVVEHTSSAVRAEWTQKVCRGECTISG